MNIKKYICVLDTEKEDLYRQLKNTDEPLCDYDGNEIKLEGEPVTGKIGRIEGFKIIFT